MITNPVLLGPLCVFVLLASKQFIHERYPIGVQCLEDWFLDKVEGQVFRHEKPPI